MKSTRRSLPIMPVFAVLGCLVAAQPGNASGLWIDKYGRSTEMHAPGVKIFRPTTNGHDLKSSVQLFKHLCVQSFSDSAAVGEAAKASDWGFTYQAELIGFKPPVDLGGWLSADALVNVSDGNFLNQQPQCNLLARVTSTFDVKAVETAVSEQLGLEPHNASDAFKKNGKPNKYYSPEWKISLADGVNAMVFARHSVNDPNVVHLALMKKQEKK